LIEHFVILPGPETGPGGDVMGFGENATDILNYTLEVEKWAVEVNESFRELERKVDALEAEVEHLKSQLAANQPGQPGKPAPDPRIDQILARLDALEKGQGRVQAPFVVLGPGGAPVFQVTAQGDALFGNPAVLTIMTNKKGVVSLAMGAGEQAGLVLSAEGNSARMVVTGADTDVTLGNSPELTGLLVEKGGQPTAGLGGIDGRPPALRVFSSSGQTLVAGGENPSAPGTGILYVGDGSQNLASLAADAAGGGIVHAFAPDGTVGAGLVGAERMVAAYNSAGAAVATIMKSDKSEGGNLTARDPGGDGVFTAGFNSAVGGGDACVYRAKRQNVFCLGIGLPGIGVVAP
jgi:hypothetical protein